MKLYARQFLLIVAYFVRRIPLTEFTIKSVYRYTIEMILCHCNQQCGQVSDWEKPDIFPYKANACRTEDKTSKRRTCPPSAGRLVTLHSCIHTSTFMEWRSEFGDNGLCSYRVRGVDGSYAKHLAVESYTVVMLLTFALIIISIPSSVTLSFQA